MAERNEKPSPRRRRAQGELLPGTVGAVDIAMEHERADPSPDNPARKLLHAQLGLVADQQRQVRAQIFSERLGAGLKLLLIFGGVVIAAALGMLVWNASHDRSLVISALTTPPDMAARGLGGEVVANQLMDKLAAIDAQAKSFRAPATFHNDWSGDIQIEIPQTGVSIGQLDRYLRQWIGRQSRIGGEIWRSGDKLNITVRAGAGVAATASGQDGELDRMLQQAAEGVFRQTQPFRYSKYLEAVGRSDEAMTVARELARHGPASEKPWAWAQVSNLLLYRGDFYGAAAAGRAAVRLDPKLGLGWLNLSIAEDVLSHQEASLAAVQTAVALLDSGDSELSDIGIATGYVNRGEVKDAKGDYAAALDTLTRAHPADYENQQQAIGNELARAHIMLHDLKAAAAIPGRLPDTEVASYFGSWGQLPLIQYSEAADLEDWPAAQGLLDAAIAATDRAGPLLEPYRERQLYGLKAVVLARLGRAAEARALVAGLPADCDRCLLARAQVAALTGDAGESDRLYGELARRAPSYIAGYERWAENLMARGDLAGAAAKLAQVHDKAPRWADPLETWGEVLIRRGDYKGAAGKLQAAAERAPRWGRAHLRWGEALLLEGEPAKARAQFVAAAGMTLSAGDRARLRVFMARTRPSP